MSNVRIRNFAYKIDWEGPSLNMDGYGEALLAALYDSPQIRNSTDTPMVMVGHSLGSLLCKSACILAFRNPVYQIFASRLQAFIFFGTPHKISDLPLRVESRLGSSVVPGSRSFGWALTQVSKASQSINDDFRSYAADLKLLSFSEAVEFTVEHVRHFSIDNVSATIDLPHEKTASIEASHRDICKFQTPSDPNYAKLKEAILFLVSDIAKGKTRTSNDIRTDSNFREVTTLHQQSARKQSVASIETSSSQDQIDNESTLPANSISTLSRLPPSTMATSIDIDQNVKKEDDIQSLASDLDEVGSQISGPRTSRQMAARDLLAALLAENSALNPLCNDAFSKLGRDRFVDNFRKLLKRCYLDLIPFAHSNLEKATIFLLKNRQSRIRIAVQIADAYISAIDEDDARPQKYMGEAEDKRAMLEDWIANNPGFKSGFPDEPAVTDPKIDGLSADDSDEDQSVDEIEEGLPRITEMGKFITEGKAFTNLLVKIHILLSPRSLRPLLKTVLSIPSERVWFSSENDGCIANTVKIFMESMTGNAWNWWPLRPKTRLLQENETRLHWLCVSILDIRQTYT